MITSKVDINELYGIKTGTPCMLTSFLHEPSQELSNSPKKCMIVCPGGGYNFTSDREAEPVAIEFFNRDYNVFLLRYNVSPVLYPTQLLELACTVDYCRKNKENFNINPDKIFAIGFSAGGHLVGTLANFHEKVPTDIISCKQLDCKPNGIILSYAVISSDTAFKNTHQKLLGSQDLSTPLARSLNLENSVSKSNPPTFLWHTAADDLVPVENALMYAEALAKNNIKFELHIYPEGPHGMSVCDERTSVNNPQYINYKVKSWIDLSDSFLKSL